MLFLYLVTGGGTMISFFYTNPSLTTPYPHSARNQSDVQEKASTQNSAPDTESTELGKGSSLCQP